MIRLLIITFFTGLLLAACSRYQKVLKSDDLNYKYTMAVQYYNKGDFYRALPLFEELIPLLRGSEKGEEVYYYFAWCQYNLEEYMLAGYYFNNFSSTYPNSRHAEECHYMSAYCYYLNSPDPSLDQTDTRKAIDAMQLFINRYPASNRVAQCNQLIDTLRYKLENKAFNNAKLYYSLGDYKSAVVAFRNALRDFPDTRYREQIRLHILKAHYQLAIHSVEIRKKERLENTLESYRDYIREYPEGQFVNQASHIYKYATMMLNETGVPGGRENGRMMDD